MCCCGYGFGDCSGCCTQCWGFGCSSCTPYCSECVGNATCNNQLCSSCLTGSCLTSADFGFSCCRSITAGTNASICANTDVSACLPFAGTDSSGNDIYQMQDGSLVYTDGSAATRADIACNCGACRGTPCSPRTCGSTDQPPSAKNTGGSPGAPMGGGSGGGSAKPSGGKSNPQTCMLSKLTQSMGKLGSTMASLLTGGSKVPAKTVIPGQKIPAASSPISSTAFLLILVVFGGLLLFMAFGHKPTPD